MADEVRKLAERTSSATGRNRPHDCRHQVKALANRKKPWTRRDEPVNHGLALAEQGGESDRPHPRQRRARVQVVIETRRR